MFVYLRYFYAVSLVLVIIGGVVIGSLIRSMTAEGLATLVKSHDEALGKQFISNVWERYYPRSAGPERFEQLAKFRAESQKFTQNLPKLRLNVVLANGRNAFSSNEIELFDSDLSELAGFVSQHDHEDQTISRILPSVSLKQGAITDRLAVVQSVIPIGNPSHQPDSPLCRADTPDSQKKRILCTPNIAYLEIVSDISQQWNELRQLQIIATASIIGVFTVLISILFFTTLRAEAIIAKQHEANAELIAAAATAEAENRDKSQFLANISHELRTPLNAIIGFSEIIKSEALPNLNPTHQEYIVDIHNSGKHLLSLINDILDYSKAEAGKLELDLADVDLCKLLLNSMRLVIPRAEQAQVTLVEDLPEEHIVCKTDGKKLKQVILNLLSNAVKFTPAGGEVRVAAWQKLLDGTICIQVKDTGIGIAPKDIAKVMSPFGQVDSALSRRYEGTGLGLPLSKKFVEIMGGDFTIESVVNEGTTITITLPNAQQDAMSVAQAPAEGASGET